jgi:CubicO group peptidase (beta-lactamase class C family)
MNRPRIVRSSLALFVAAMPWPTASLGAQRPTGAPPPPGFDAFVVQALRTFDVPGAAVGIVKDGRVILAKGYGVRTVGRPDKVDSATRFGIASNTKAFTATAIAMLVEAGKLEWDAPVIRSTLAIRLDCARHAQRVTSKR